VAFIARIFQGSPYYDLIGVTRQDFWRAIGRGIIHKHEFVKLARLI